MKVMGMKTIPVKEIIILGIMAAIFALFMYGLGSALIPLMFSLLLAYASLPLVKKIERKGLTRFQSTAVVLTLVTFIIITLLFLIIPPLFSDLREAALALPGNMSVALVKLDAVLSEYGIHVPYDRQSLIDFAGAYSEKISENALRSAGGFISNSLVNAASFIVILLNIFLVPVFFAYVVNDSEQLVKKVEHMVPPSKRPTVHSFLKEIDGVLSGYIRGQLLVCLILSVLYTAVLLIVGIKFAVVIGVMTGFLSIIPYVGYAFGFAAALITALANFEGGGAFVGIAIGYSIVQFFESFFITPKIVGDKVGLTPFEAILALIVLGNLLGFIGLFLAIPVGAVTKILFRHLLAEYKNTSFYKS